MLSSNPASDVDLPKRERREMRALDPEEVERFQKAAKKDHRGIVFTFMLATGMRPSEVLAAQWKDIDPEVGSIKVQRTLVRLKGSWHFAEPKTRGSRRMIPLPASMSRTLVEHRRTQAERRLRLGPAYHDHDLVFGTDEGKPLDLHNLTNPPTSSPSFERQA
jgi:integrase